MRGIFPALAIVVCLAAPSYAQTGGAAYLEVGGNALSYSVNLEQMVSDKVTTRFGGMLVPGAAVGTISVNRLFGGRNQFLVVGVGATYGVGETIFKAATATVGYRYMRPGGLFFQWAATPLFSRDGDLGWFGISIGKSF
jgi:hypothetical protein